MEKGYALERKTARLKFSSESARKAFLADAKAQNFAMKDGEILGFDDYVKTFKASDPSAILPEGGIYTALLQSSGNASVWDDTGCLLTCTYTLAGYRHGPLGTVSLEYSNKGVMPFFVSGNAPQMECRLTVTAADYSPDTPDKPDSTSTQATSSTAEAKTYTVTVHYPDGGACSVTGIAEKDTIVVDGIEKQVLVNGVNAFQNVTAISGWPTVCPGANTMDGYLTKTLPHYFADPCIVEYYPIFM